MQQESAENDFVFTPVTVRRGRKFRGEAYYLGKNHDYENAFGLTSQLWSPDAGRLVYATSNFAEPDESRDPAVVADAKARYVEFVKQTVLRYAKSVATTDADVNERAKYLIRKRFPELSNVLLPEFPDLRNACDETERTISWAMTLCAKSGRGNPYSDRKRVRIAWAALHNSGASDLPGFEDAWSLQLTLRGLSKYDPAQQS